MFIQHFEPWVGALQISIISITIITLCNQLKLFVCFSECTDGRHSKLWARRKPVPGKAGADVLQCRECKPSRDQVQHASSRKTFAARFSQRDVTLSEWAHVPARSGHCVNLDLPSPRVLQLCVFSLSEKGRWREKKKANIVHTYPSKISVHLIVGKWVLLNFKIHTHTHSFPLIQIEELFLFVYKVCYWRKKKKKKRRSKNPSVIKK